MRISYDETSFDLSNLLILCLSGGKFNKNLEPEFRPRQVEPEVGSLGFEVLNTYHSI